MTINYGAPGNPGYQFTGVGQYPGMQSFPQAMPPMMNPEMYESSYIENILRLNRGKIATIYMNFEGSQWGSKIYRGELLGAGKDHIILKDASTNVHYLLLTIYLSYVTFDEPIEYSYPYDTPVQN